MCLITLQGTCHKSCYKFGAATSKWSRFWSFCNSICHVENPTLCSYNLPLMRQHLVNCLEKEMMYPFPKQDITKRVLKCQKNQLLLSIYCSCRSVCQYERENPMVECMKCYEWFHQKCEKIPRKVFANKAANFFCKGCY